MDDKKIRQIVQEELRRNNSQDRFGYSTIPFHTHNGKDSPNILAENVTPSTSALGTIEISTEGGIYSLNMNANFTPRLITAYGVVTGTYDATDIRAIVTGSAQLTPSFYFQPDSGLSATTNNIEYPLPTTQPDGSTPTVPAQSSVYFLGSRQEPSYLYAGTSENHLVSVSGFPTSDVIHARVTVVGYNKNQILLSVPYLDDGWTVFLTCIIS